MYASGDWGTKGSHQFFRLDGIFHFDFKIADNFVKRSFRSSVAIMVEAYNLRVESQAIPTHAHDAIGSYILDSIILRGQPLLNQLYTIVS